MAQSGGIALWESPPQNPCLGGGAWGGAYILLFCEFAFSIVFGFGVLKNGLPVRLDI